MACRNIRLILFRRNVNLIKQSRMWSAYGQQSRTLIQVAAIIRCRGWRGEGLKLICAPPGITPVGTPKELRDATTTRLILDTALAMQICKARQTSAICLAIWGLLLKHVHVFNLSVQRKKGSAVLCLWYAEPLFSYAEAASSARAVGVKWWSFHLPTLLQNNSS